MMKIYIRLFSQEFLLELGGYAKNNRRAMRKLLKQYINQEVRILTEAGSIEGVVQVVDQDYVEISEPSNTLNLISFNQILSIQAL